MKNKFLLIRVVCLIFVILGGCATPQVSYQGNLNAQKEDDTPAIGPDDAIGVIGEKDFIDCVGRNLRRGAPNVRVMTEKEIRKNLPPQEKPTPIEFLLRENWAKLGIRHMVKVEGNTTSSSEASGSCGPGYGCIAFFWWKKMSQIRAQVWDLKENFYRGEFNAWASGKPWFAIIWIFPIGMPVATEWPTCRALGAEVGQFILGNNAQEVDAANETVEKGN